MKYPNHTLIGVVLSHAAPASNSHGQSQENRLVLQSIQFRGKRYAIISAEAIRNALREALIRLGYPHNRERVLDEDQLAVKTKGFPDANLYADDFLFGFMVTDKAAKAKFKGFPHRRQSLVQVNLARALDPKDDPDTLIVQSPLHVAGSGFTNAKSSALLEREIEYTQFQYPFVLRPDDCLSHPEWAMGLLRAIGQLSGAAGNHSRAYFELAPESIVVCLTPRLTANFDLYGFRSDGTFAPFDLVRRGVLPASEFWVGGSAVDQVRDIEGMHLFDSPLQLLDTLSKDVFSA